MKYSIQKHSSDFGVSLMQSDGLYFRDVVAGISSQLNRSLTILDNEVYVIRRLRSRSNESAFFNQKR